MRCKYHVHKNWVKKDQILRELGFVNNRSTDNLFLSKPRLIYLHMGLLQSLQYQPASQDDDQREEKRSRDLLVPTV